MTLITLGRSNRKPAGWRVEVPNPFCDNLQSTLELHTFQGENEAWWSPFIFEGDYRKLDNWLGAGCVAIDADYYSRAEKAKDRHSAPPAETVAELLAAMEARAVVCSCWHLTPRGVRFIFALDAEVIDKPTMEGVVAGCAALVNEGLLEANLAASFDGKGKPLGGYLSDTAAMDLAHFMYTPTALVQGRQRDAKIISLTADLFPVEDLASYVPIAAANPNRAGLINNAKVGEVGKVLSKMDCEGGNDGSGALMKVCRKAIQLGVTDSEVFAQEVQAWNLKRDEPWLHEDLTKRFNDAMTRWSQEGRVHVPTTKDGRPILSLNAIHDIMRGDSLFRELDGSSVFWLDLLKRKPMVGDKPMTDVIVTTIRRMIAEKYDSTAEVKKENVRDVFEEIAHENEVHPIEKYLLGLEWDGVERIKNMAWEVFRSKEAIYTTYLRKWLISGVARICDPGCQADCALTLVGEQYTGKGSFFRAMAKQENWHSGSEIDLAFRQGDALQVIHTFWIYEIEELDKIFDRNGSAGKLKAFMTQKTDSFVAKYDKFAMEHMRKFIFGASANDDEVLKDPTGDRRFYCIAVPDAGVRYQWVQEHVDQLWAEALTLYAKGEPWHLNKVEDAERAEANKLFHPENLFEERIDEILKQMQWPEKVLSCNLVKRLFPGLSGNMGKIPHNAKIAIGTIMRRYGYMRRTDGKRRYWQKIDRKDKGNY